MRLSSIAAFLKLESASGILLFVMAIAAFIICNSPLAAIYQKIWAIPIAIHIGHYALARPMLFWVNEGLMSLFFLLVGLELKWEFLVGELAKVSQVVLPAVAAAGGMLVPAVLFYVTNAQHPAFLQAWAVPVATDIAFALGVLSLFGQRVPVGLKLFLMALAIFDDVGAIIIIAISHTKSLSITAFILALFLISLLVLLNKGGVRRLWPYLLVGIALWLCVLKSGVHATVAGVLLAFLIPLSSQDESKISPLAYLENALHPWVAYGVMPLFALANAGLSLQGLGWGIFTNTLVLGVALGLFVGKQIGVFSSACLLIKLGWAQLPEQTSWLELYAVAILCGIGFTMSLFLGTLAFQGSDPVYLIEVRLGVLLGSILSGIVGAGLLHMAIRNRYT